MCEFEPDVSYLSNYNVTTDYSYMLQTMLEVFRSENTDTAQGAFPFPKEQLLKGLPWKEKLFSLPLMLLLPEPSGGRNSL